MIHHKAGLQYHVHRSTYRSVLELWDRSLELKFPPHTRLVVHLKHSLYQHVPPLPWSPRLLSLNTIIQFHCDNVAIRMRIICDGNITFHAKPMRSYYYALQAVLPTRLEQRDSVCIWFCVLYTYCRVCLG